MSSLVVQSPGLLTMVQDLGRAGYGALGISPSGAADPVALRLGNLLVGNLAGAAALEMTLLGGSFVFPEGAVVAVTGADFGATIDGRAVEMWRAHTIARGGVLAFGATRNFARSYLTVAGGIQVAPFLGSAATHLLSGLGGLEGRALRRGDVLRLGKRAAKIPKGRISLAALQTFRPRKVLRVTAGPQIDVFSEEAREAFFCGTFRVSEASDRTGLRLEGHSIQYKLAEEMITEGVPLGAIQVTPSGQPIVLFVEQQTTGGYPKIANVIGVDLHRVGQLRPRVEVRFERTSLEVAQSLWIEQERLLNSPGQLLS
ncbi:MAG: biotin-dependent carboxyltransferase family protein [Candidatus Acidiferrum sp.]|jgi:antagonist of KipI